MPEERNGPEDPRTTSPASRNEDTAYYEAVGRAIKVLRAERGLGRKDLAKGSGVSYPYLTEIENGKKRPSSKALLLIAEALGVLPYELLQNAERWVDREPATDEAPMSALGPPPAAPLASPSPPALRAKAAPPAGTDPRGWFHRRRVDRMADEVPPKKRSSTLGTAKPDGPPAAAELEAPSGTEREAPRPELIEELVDMASRLSPEDLETLLRLARRLEA